MNTDTRNNDRCANCGHGKKAHVWQKVGYSDGCLYVIGDDHPTQMCRCKGFTPAPQAEPAEVCGCSHLESQHEADVCTAPNPREHETELGVCYCNDFDPERDDSFRWQTFSVVPEEGGR